MGSQVREITDELALKFKDTPRDEWHQTLEQKSIYLLHRSFSWVILIIGIILYTKTRKTTGDLGQLSLKVVFGIILGYVFLGEIITPKVIVAVAAVVLGIYFVRRSIKNNIT